MRHWTSNVRSDSRKLAALFSSVLFALAAFASPLRPATVCEAGWSRRDPWRMEAREKLTASVSLRWTRTDHYKAGALLPKPSTWTFSCELLLKGNSMRYAGKIFNHARGNISLIDYTSTFDGKESRRLLGIEPLYGSIHRVKETPSFLLESPPHLAPSLLFFRPLADPYGTLQRRSWKLVKEHKLIDGHNCVTVDDGRTHAYLDCDRDFIPVAFDRYTLKDHLFMYRGSLEYYRSQGAMRWVPKSFLVKLHSHARDVADEIRGDGVQTELDVPLKDSNFHVNFKPGTVVWDAGTEQEYRVRDDGSKEPFRWPLRPQPVPAKSVGNEK